MLDLGSNIRKYRKARRLSQEQVGQVLGLNRSSVSKIERGETIAVKPEQVAALCKLFECSPTDLLGMSSVKVSSSAPLTADQQKLIAAVSVLNEDQVRVLLEMVRVMAHASL